MNLRKKTEAEEQTIAEEALKIAKTTE